MSAIDALLAGPLAAMTVGGVVYGWLGAACVRLWLGETLPEAEARKQPPLTLLRPIKAGVPALREKLDELVRAMRPGDQLVLGVDFDSPDLAACEAVRAAFPDREVMVVACQPGTALNPKVSKLLQMEPHGRHEHLVLSDCEALIDAAWLEAFRNEWVASRADVLTAPYRFAGLTTRPQRADAVALLLGLWPGLALVRALGQVRFTLGACTALRRADLAAVGGWAALGDFLAEDHRLGVLLAERGARIRLSTQVVPLESDPLSWSDYWRHQQRVAVTYRVCEPRGFAGMIVTHSVTASVLMFLLAPFSGAPGWWLLWGLAAVGARGLAAMWLAQVTRFPIPELWRVLVPAGLVESTGWGLSWFSTRVWWAGRWFEVEKDGRLVAIGE